MIKDLVIKILLSLMALILCFDAYAVVVEDLYSASVSVEDKSERARGEAIREALGVVFVKLTGSSEALTDPGVIDVLEQAQRYVVEYGYVERVSSPLASDVSTNDELYPARVDTSAIGSSGIGSSDISSPGMGVLRPGMVDLSTPVIDAQSTGRTSIDRSVMLNVSFEARALQAVLRDLFLPVWPGDRPVLMVWLVRDTAKGYQFLDSSDDGPVLAKAEMALKARGIAFKMPLYDLQDQMTLSAERAWLADDDKLTQASRRYGIDYWMTLSVPDDRVKLSGLDSYRGRWTLGGEVARASGIIAAQSPSEWIDGAIGGAIDQFSKGFTYQAGQLGERIHLLITDIDSYQDYSRLTDLLGKLEVVESVQVTRVEKADLYLDLIIEGDAQLLINALGINDHFVRVVDMGDNIGQSLFRFQWQAPPP